VVEPVPSISSVWAKPCTRTSPVQSRARHRKQSYPCASITAIGANPAHGSLSLSLCMHTQDGFAAHLRAFESGACCEDRQPTEVSETFQVFFPLDCFCCLASANSTATIIAISAASCRRKHIAMLLAKGAQWRRRKP